ncbi:hypothetical protein QBC38DRAFT_124439 [Podospora fimiseda]|uniref:Uncharacterized protein n=1 Tax=Podospora fimiseda TaxID=252190 RepID=A0AAN7H1H3_9PEZI|nr:hypothetical protein QBC38DRAFT_124439 [Podospora fimiseda]
MRGKGEWGGPTPTPLSKFNFVQLCPSPAFYTTPAMLRYLDTWMHVSRPPPCSFLTSSTPHPLFGGLYFQPLRTTTSLVRAPRESIYHDEPNIVKMRDWRSGGPQYLGLKTSHVDGRTPRPGGQLGSQGCTNGGPLSMSSHSLVKPAIDPSTHTHDPKICPGSRALLETGDANPSPSPRHVFPVPPLPRSVRILCFLFPPLSFSV